MTQQNPTGTRAPDDATQHDAAGAPARGQAPDAAAEAAAAAATAADSGAAAAAAADAGAATPGIRSRVFRGALFDMDGTLIDSTPAVDRSWTTWGEEWGLDPAFRDGMHGKPAIGLVSAVIAPEHVSEAFARILHLELVDVEGITPLAGAADLLGSLPEEQRAIVTSCTRDLAAVRIAASGIPAPATVVTIDDTERGKPNPDPFLEGARRLGLDPRDCLVVEDAPAGLAAGRAAGCTTIGVVGTHSAAELDADLVVESLADLRFVPAPGGYRLAY